MGTFNEYIGINGHLLTESMGTIENLDRLNGRNLN
jgi:hypothetical protein